MKTNSVQRTFSIGDHWIYYKIYCGIYLADTILTDTIKPLCDNLIKEKIVTKWFFLRHKDTDSHLRIRFFVTNLTNFGIVIEQIREALSRFIKSNEVWDLQLHTYNREIKRYGINTIEIAESLFFYDSGMVIEALKLKSNNIEYFLFVIKAVDCILSYFEYSDDKKLHLLEKLRSAFKKELNIDKATVKQMDSKYRLLKAQVESTLELKTKSTLNNLVAIKNNISQSTIKQLLVLSKNDKLLVNIDELLSSYMHMTVNRSFRSSQRLHELLIYDMLYRFYKSKVLRK